MNGDSNAHTKKRAAKGQASTVKDKMITRREVVAGAATVAAQSSCLSMLRRRSRDSAQEIVMAVW